MYLKINKVDNKMNLNLKVNNKPIKKWYTAMKIVIINNLIINKIIMAINRIKKTFLMINCHIHHLINGFKALYGITFFI